MIALADRSVVDLAAELIRISSVSGNEHAAVDAVAGWLDQAGFVAQRLPVGDGRMNLFAEWAGGSDLVLCGHLDTVPLWRGGTTPPLLPVVRDGRLYGRGASDMKGAVAAMCLAATQHARSRKGGVTLLFTVGEEVGCEGAVALPASGVLSPSNVVIVGESTANRVRYGHKGAVWLEIEATGRAAHGSRPDLGTNAVSMLAGIVAELGETEDRVAHPFLGARTVSVGTFHGGEQTNLVPDRAVATVDVRTVPDDGATAIESEVGSIDGVSSRRILDLPSVWSPHDSPAATVVRQVVESVTSTNQDSVAGTAFFTDIARIAEHVRAAFVLGPGDPDQPHTVDESCPVHDLEEAVVIYRALLSAAAEGAFSEATVPRSTRDTGSST
jgi:succinyl-diaminopimelate desuccinylase